MVTDLWYMASLCFCHILAMYQIKGQWQCFILIIPLMDVLEHFPPIDIDIFLNRYFLKILLTVTSLYSDMECYLVSAPKILYCIFSCFETFWAILAKTNFFWNLYYQAVRNSLEVIRQCQHSKGMIVQVVMMVLWLQEIQRVCHLFWEEQK